MTSHLFALGFDANDPLRLTHFWAASWAATRVANDRRQASRVEMTDPDDNEFCALTP